MRAGDARTEKFRRLLRVTFDLCDPVKLDEVEEMLERHKGSEEELYEQVCLKYYLINKQNVPPEEAPTILYEPPQLQTNQVPVQTGTGERSSRQSLPKVGPAMVRTTA